MINEWDITETNLGRLAKRKYEVAVLPTSAIEPHNRHLPQGQDFFHSNHVAREACAAAWEKIPAVLCLPGLPYGVDGGLMDFPIAVHVSQANLDAMIGDIVRSLRHYGIRKFVLVNGHGGNDFTPFIRQIQLDTDAHVFQCDWWKMGNDVYPQIFDFADDHAGELETSVAMELYPELVEMESAGDGASAEFAFEALRKGWVKTSRQFSKLNDHCAVGNPHRASAEKGREYLELVIGRLSDFLAELCLAPIDDRFPMMGE